MLSQVKTKGRDSILASIMSSTIRKLTSAGVPLFIVSNVSNTNLRPNHSRFSPSVNYKTNTLTSAKQKKKVSVWRCSVGDSSENSNNSEQSLFYPAEELQEGKTNATGSNTDGVEDSDDVEDRLVNDSVLLDSIDEMFNDLFPKDRDTLMSIDPEDSTAEINSEPDATKSVTLPQEDSEMETEHNGNGEQNSRKPATSPVKQKNAENVKKSISDTMDNWNTADLDYENHVEEEMSVEEIFNDDYDFSTFTSQSMRPDLLDVESDDFLDKRIAGLLKDFKMDGKRGADVDDDEDDDDDENNGYGDDDDDDDDDNVYDNNDHGNDYGEYDQLYQFIDLCVDDDDDADGIEQQPGRKSTKKKKKKKRMDKRAGGMMTPSQEAEFDMLMVPDGLEGNVEKLLTPLFELTDEMKAHEVFQRIDFDDDGPLLENGMIDYDAVVAKERQEKEQKKKQKQKQKQDKKLTTDADANDGAQSSTSYPSTGASRGRGRGRRHG